LGSEILDLQGGEGGIAGGERVFVLKRCRQRQLVWPGNGWMGGKEDVRGGGVNVGNTEGGLPFLAFGKGELVKRKEF